MSVLPHARRYSRMWILWDVRAANPLVKAVQSKVQHANPVSRHTIYTHKQVYVWTFALLPTFRTISFANYVWIGIHIARNAKLRMGSFNVWNVSKMTSFGVSFVSEYVLITLSNKTEFAYPKIALKFQIVKSVLILNAWHAKHCIV